MTPRPFDFKGPRTWPERKHRSLLAALGVRSLGFFLVVGALTFGSALSLGDGRSPGGKAEVGQYGSDPTVGTLPMMGGGGEADLDQTITLRGRIDDLRGVLVDASGAGFVEVIDLGQGEGWVRFYGDVRLELSADRLSNFQVAVFSGFEGGGMRYLVQTSQGYGAVQSLASGYELPIDLVRLSGAGVLDEPAFIYSLHQTGARASTSIQSDPLTGNVVIFQDV